MKKLLLIAILMLALVFTVVACNNDKPDETTAGETTAASEPQATEPQATEPQATEPQATEPQATEPQATEPQATEPQATEPQATEPQETEPETVDPAAPVVVIDPAAMAAGQPVNNATVEVNEAGYASFTATSGDPWVTIAGNLGAMPEYLAISYRTNTTQPGEFFIGNGAGPEGGKSFSFNYNANSEWNLLVFHLPTVASYMTDNTVGHIRYDFFNAGPEEGAFLDVEYVAFFNTAEYAEAYHFEKHPAYVAPEDAGKVGVSYDTFYVNGVDYFNTAATGQVNLKLDEANNTITFAAGEARETVMLRGWAGFNQPIASYGYFVDNYSMVYGEFAVDAEPAVKEPGNGGEHATRFEITVPVAELEHGAHTIGFVVKLEDGTVVLLHKVITLVVPFDVPEHTEETIDLGKRGNGGPFSGMDKKKYGQRFDIGENFLKTITVKDMAAYANPVNTWAFRIWAWDTDYATTTAAAPIFELTGENHPDNTTFTVADLAAYGITGDFYYEIEHVSGDAGFTGWKAEEYVAEGVQTYVAGELVEGTYASSIVVGVAVTEEPVELKNLALNKPTTATSAQNAGQFPAVNATDGDMATRWGSEPTVSSDLIVDLETVCTLYEISVSFEQVLMPYTVSVSEDGENYNVVYEGAAEGWLSAPLTKTVELDKISARYVKVSSLHPEGADALYFSVYELSVMGPAVPTNVAKGKPTTATSAQNAGQFPAVNATDGDITTRWAAEPTISSDLIVDLESLCTLYEITVTFEQVHMPYTISVSEDGENYTVVYEGAAEGWLSAPLAKTVELDKISARYVKVSGLHPEGADVLYFSVYELSVMGFAGPTNVAKGKPTTATSAQNAGQFPAENATDGDEATRWSSEPTVSSDLIVDLEAVYNLTEITAVFEQVHMPYTYSVSEDGENYTVVYEGAAEGWLSAPLAKTVELDNVSARYVKVSSLHPEGADVLYFAVYELYALGIAQ